MTWSEFQLVWVGSEPGSYSTSVAKDLNCKSSVQGRTCNSEATSSSPAQHKSVLTRLGMLPPQVLGTKMSLAEITTGRAEKRNPFGVSCSKLAFCSFIALLFAAVQMRSDRRRCFMQVSGSFSNQP